MDGDFISFAVGRVLDFISAGLCGAAIGILIGHVQIKDEAIRHNAAEWRVDIAGRVTFQWKGEEQ